LTDDNSGDNGFNVTFADITTAARLLLRVDRNNVLDDVAAGTGTNGSGGGDVGRTAVTDGIG